MSPEWVKAKKQRPASCRTLVAPLEPPRPPKGCSRRFMPPVIGPETNISELVAELPIAEGVLERFGLHCAGCGVNKYETIAQGAAAHGLRVEPIVAALSQARLSGRVPTISNEDREPKRRAPGEFARRAKFAHVVPI